MKEQKFIIDEVKKHLQASARKNKYQVIDAVQEMPTFEGFMLSYYSQRMFSYYPRRLDGTQFPVDVEAMYINSDEWDEFYNEAVTKVVQAILETEQIKEA